MKNTEHLREIYALVGESATAWNQVETLWYLIFTGLMHETSREKVDAIFGMFLTGALQRQLVTTVAPIALTFDVQEIRKRNYEHHLRRRILKLIGQLNSRTNGLAGKRNAVIHTAFEDWGRSRIIAAGSHKPSKLRDENLPIYLKELIEDTTLLAYELAELRDLLVDLITPEDRENRKIRNASMRSKGYLPPEDVQKMEKEALQKAVYQRKPPQPAS